jgi:ElaB/YqjD/DUF883 family membrane-anchored ribosome-binding protein
MRNFKERKRGTLAVRTPTREAHVAKDKKAKPSPPAKKNGKAGPDPDEMPEVVAAQEAVRRAKAELARAQELYVGVRRQATDQLRQIKGKTVGELMDGTLKLVKKHPGPGVVIAALLGVFLGRLFRR